MSFLLLIIAGILISAVMALTKPTLSGDLTTGDLANLNSQLAQVNVDRIYFGAGELTAAEAADLFAGQDNLDNETTGIPGITEEIGELAEKPIKFDSKSETAKTRHYKLETKRTNTIAITINGISEDKKTLLESWSKNMTQLTAIAVPKGAHTQAILMNGRRWTVDWSGESDGLWTMVLSTEFTGTTENIIGIYTGIPETAPA